MVDYPDKAKEPATFSPARPSEGSWCGSGCGCLDRSLQTRRYPRGGLPRHVLGAPGCRARRHERLGIGSEIIGAELAGELVRAFCPPASAAASALCADLPRLRKWREAMPESRLQQLSALGQSVWIDSLSREWIQTGELERMMREDAVVGVTSNPTIFQKAMAEGDWYDEQLREVIETESDPKEIFLQLAVRDIQEACDPLPPGLGRGQGPGRLRLDRSRSGTCARDPCNDRAGPAFPRMGRPSKRAREDPGDEGRPAGDRGDDRARAQHQRHADLLAAALRRGRRGLHQGARATRQGRRRPDHGRVRGELLRLTSTPRRTSGWTRPGIPS